MPAHAHECSVTLATSVSLGFCPSVNWGCPHLPTCLKGYWECQQVPQPVTDTARDREQQETHGTQSGPWGSRWAQSREETKDSGAPRGTRAHGTLREGPLAPDREDETARPSPSVSDSFGDSQWPNPVGTLRHRQPTQPASWHREGLDTGGVGWGKTSGLCGVNIPDPCSMTNELPPQSAFRMPQNSAPSAQEKCAIQQTPP